MLAVAPLGESPLFATLFANHPIDESFEAAFDRISDEQMRFLLIHCFPARQPRPSRDSRAHA
jgi:hypothetical protein